MLDTKNEVLSNFFKAIMYNKGIETFDKNRIFEEQHRNINNVKLKVALFLLFSENCKFAFTLKNYKLQKNVYCRKLYMAEERKRKAVHINSLKLKVVLFFLFSENYIF